MLNFTHSLSIHKMTWLFAGALALLISGVALNSATTAFFTATTSVTGTTFTTSSFAVSNSATSGSGGSGKLADFNSMMPGDASVGYVTITNGSAPTSSARPGTPDMTYVFDTSAATSSALNTTAFASGGLGLLAFRCYAATTAASSLAASNVASCGTAPASGSTLYLEPLYGSCASGTAGPAAPSGTTTYKLSSSASTLLQNVASSVTTSSSTLSIGGWTCTGANITASKTALGGPSAVAGVVDATSGTGTAQSFGVLAGNSDFLGFVSYLPSSSTIGCTPSSGTATSCAATGPSVMTVTFTAEQRAGATQ